MQVDVPFEFGTVVLWQYTAHSVVRLKFINRTGEILLNIGVRHHEQVVIFNSELNGTWGKEERPSGFPLCVGSETRVTVVAGEEGFEIYAGENFCYTFQYRRPLNEVKLVTSTEGKVEIGKVSMGIEQA